MTKILQASCILIIFSFFQLATISAQPPNASFRNITSAEGLPNTSVAGITQDALGFIWISTWAGVFRYDGKKFVLKSNADCRIITADKKGGVWMSVTSPDVILYYDSFADSVKSYNIPNSGRTSIVQIDAVGSVWAATDLGICKLDTQADSFMVEKGQQRIPWRSFSARGKGELIFITKFGDQSTRTIGMRDENGKYSYENFPADKNNPDPSKSFLDANVRIEVRFKDSGYLILNKYGWAYKESTGGDWIFRKPDSKNLLENLLENFSEVLLDGNNNLWIEQPDALSRLDLNTGKMVTYRHDKTNSNTILPFSGSGGSTIFIDRQGILWATRYGTGISRLNLYESDFGLLRDENGNVILDVLSAFELTDGSYLIGERTAGNSLFHFSPDGKVIKRYGTTSYEAPVGKSVGSELSHPFAWSLCVSRDGSIWAGTGWPRAGQGGLNHFSLDKPTITRYKNDPADTSSIPDDWIFGIIERPDGKLWIRTARAGWCLFDPVTEKIERGFNQEGYEINEYDNFRIELMLKNGDLIYSINRRHFRVDYYSLVVTPILDSLNLKGSSRLMLEDDSGNIWFKDRTGFGYINPSFQKVAWFYNIKQNKFPADDIETLNIDDAGKIWLATNNGLVQFDRATETFIHYGYERGLQSNSFLQRVNHKGKSGKLYFGGTGGINVFDPAAITINPFAPEIAFTGLQLDGKEIQFSDTAAIRLPIAAAENITVSPGTSVISIDFAALHFAGDRQNTFQYRLEGFDKDWRDGGNIGNATYTNLSPGKYRLFVKAANWDGVWSDGSKSIAIHILPPWWRTWWAYTLYALLALGILWQFYQYQKARALRKERERNQRRELEQAKLIEKAYADLALSHDNLKATQAQLIQSEKMASLGELTAGIAHEIQNPLNFVNNFSEVNKELVDELKTELATGNMQLANEIADDIKANEEKINHHGKRADAIVKGMLQHSSSSSGVKEPTDINALCDEYLRLSYHGLRAKDKSFNADFKTDLDNSIGKINVVPQDIGRVLLNLINNAFYAVQEKSLASPEGYQPLVTVSTRNPGDSIIITVRDNGAGIPEAIKEKIFQPFFTTKPTGQGTGLGLSLSYDIIKANGGEIKVESKENEGTEFMIQLHVV